MTSGAHTMADAAAMRRALELAARGPATRREPAGRLRDPRRATASVHRRGLAPRRRHRARRGRRALASSPPGAADGATAVVTLEPCNHTGRTGPCAGALIDAGVAPRRLRGRPTPATHSAGGARAPARRRRRGGTAACSPTRPRRCSTTGSSRARLGRPFVTVKWASSLDGRAAAADGTSQWITGPAARADVHRRRAAADAIVVGTGTVLADDPALTARDAGGELLDAPADARRVRPTRAVPADAADLPSPARALSSTTAPISPPSSRDLHAPRHPLALRRGRPDARERVHRRRPRRRVARLPRARRCSAARGSRSATSASPSIASARRLDFADVERLGDDLCSSPAPTRARPAPTRQHRERN